MSTSQSNLFRPIKCGQMDLKHRVVMAPLTRFRADDQHVHTEIAAEYYQQRACVPGTLLITEATFISEAAGGFPNVPGIYNDAQVTAWKKITDAVHAKGSYIYCQLWALGRVADPNALQKGCDVVSASDLKFGDTGPVPRPLTVEEIKQYMEQYRKVSELAMQAGFDGVEVHGANGYLVDQFIQDVSNRRIDDYGGSIENRCRFALEAVQACVDTIGADKVAIRLSPWSSFQGMKMDDPIPTFSYLIKTLPQDLAYLHVVESRIQGNADITENPLETTEFARQLWKKGPFFTAGGYRTKSAIEVADQADNICVVMGRYFVSNPDLVLKMKSNAELTPYNRDTFYSYKDRSEGYTDYPFSQAVESKA